MKSPPSQENAMTSELDPGISRKLAQFVSFCSVLALAFGLWVLGGWTFHIHSVKSVLPGQVMVKANTAACFLLLGFALWVLRKEQPPAAGWKLAAKVAAAIASVVGVLSLIEGIGGWELGIDHLLFAAGPDDIPGSLRPGLMSPITAFGFLSLGPALLLLDAKSRPARWAAQLLPCGAAVAAMFGVLDFVLDPASTHTYMSPVTAFVLFLVSFAVMLARTHSGLPALVASTRLGGTLTRRLFPAAILVPLVIGWLRWKGEGYGVFSEWTGLTIMTVFSTVLLASLTAWTASLIDRTQREREQTEQARNATEERLRLLLDGVRDYAIYMLDPEGRVISWNAGAENLKGYRAEEILSQHFSCFYTAKDRENGKPKQELEQAISLGRFEDQGERVRRDGSAFWANFVIAPLCDEPGKLRGFSKVVRDVTERKRAQEQLRKSSLYTRSLLEASLDPLVTISREGKITDVNEATEKVTGVSRERLIGSDFSNSFTDPESARRGYEQVFAQGAVQDYPLAIRSTAGKVTDVLYNATVFKNEAGEVEGIFAAARDVTEKKRAQEAVAAEREKLNIILDVLPPYVVLLTPDYHVAFANREFRKRFGESNGRRCYEFLFGRAEPCEICETYKVLQAKKPLEWKWTGPDGRHYDIYDFPFTDTDGSTLILEMGIDVTERRQAEAALLESETKFRTLAELAPQLVWMCTPDGLNVYFNPRWMEYTGLTLEESYGRGWNTPFHPDDKQAAWDAWNHAVATGDTYRVESRLRAADGSYRWFLMRGVPLRDASGTIVKWFGTCTDIEDLKRAEEVVRKLNDELEDRVRQRTAQLEAANKELEAFTYSVSHDLRAPLRHISGFSKILTEEYASSLAPDAQHHLRRIQEGTRRMGLLVDDLLNLGRVGRHEVRLQVAGLNSIVNEVVDELKPECAGRQVEWKVDNLPFVECDPALMKQVFQNLLSNAVKFSRPRSPAIIEVGQKDQEGTPVVFVRDNGVGFNTKYADKLFGVFQRLHRAEDFEGTGVGLATVQRIIQKHGGRIWAEAELDKGATFYFTLGASETSELKTKAAMVGDKE